MPHLAGGTAAQGVAPRVGEHQGEPAGAVPGQVGGEGRDHHVGHGDGAEPGLGLRGSELGDAVAGGDELAVDAELAT